MNLNRYSIIATLALVVFSLSAHAQEDGWPRTVMLDEGMVTVYAPQLEAMNGGVLYYRAALAYRPDTDAEPIFGAGWLKSDVDIDDEENIVSPRGLSLTQTRFPEGTTDIEAELATALSRQSARWNLDFTVNELEAALDAAEAESLAAQKLKTTPPRIIYRDQPALLVSIDGEPVLREIEDSPYKAVINTPFPLVTDGKTYYLNAAKNAWYRSNKATGPYDFDTRPPQDIVAMVESGKKQVDNADTSEENEEPVTAANAPEIVVSTVPAELIVTEGPADFVPLVDDLLVLKNSPEDVFMHVGEQKYYIVLAGRWYQSGSLNGPWDNQSADDLPEAFSKIPTDSPQAESRVYIAGTPEAEEAVLDAQVPQTAAVKRGQVDITVDYDGDPEFERVEGTDDLYYAENTGATVLESDRTYYLLEDGVWYVSGSPHGPWVVSDHRPGELESVEPSSPVYNTKYVHVYDSTPDVVYVGYTPGYVGSYVYGPTLVYGTGYYYRPWISPYYYYPRFRTWGWSVGYSSYGGWSFGFGWNYGGWNLSYYSGGYWHYGQPWYNRYYGYWGPGGYYPTPYYGGYYGGGYRHNPYGKRYAYNRGYRSGYRDGYGDGNYDNPGHGRSGHGDRGGRRSRDDGYDGGGRGGDGYRDGRQRNRNLYRDDSQRARVVQTRDTWNRRPDTSAKPAPGQFARDKARNTENRKIAQSKTGPVSRTDMRNKARVRDINRAASREPMVASAAGEVRRAEFGANTRNRAQRDVAQRDAGQRIRRDSKIGQNRTGPVTRNELEQRGDLVATRSNQATRKNRNDRNNRTVASAPREVQRATTKTRSNRQVVSEPRALGNTGTRNRSTREVTSQPRVVKQESRSTRSVRQREPQVRQRESQVRQREPQMRQREPQVRQREPQVRQRSQAAPQRQVQAPRVQQQRVQTPRVQQSRPQQRSAPAPRPQQRSAPRPQQRSAPAPRPQQRSAPRPSRGESKRQDSPSRNQGSPQRRRKN